MFINLLKTVNIRVAAMLAKESAISVGLFNKSAANKSIYASRADIAHFGFNFQLSCILGLTLLIWLCAFHQLFIYNCASVAGRDAILFPALRQYLDVSCSCFGNLNCNKPLFFVTS
jgi:hypothetical protein